MIMEEDELTEDDMQIEFQIGLHREFISVKKSLLSLISLKELAATVLEKQVLERRKILIYK